jgi:hypothetical protein
LDFQGIEKAETSIDPASWEVYQPSDDETKNILGTERRGGCIGEGDAFGESRGGAAVFFVDKESPLP